MFSVRPQDLGSSSKEQLDERLRALRSPSAQTAAAEQGDQAWQELQVRRIEIEMTQRALRETQEELEQAVARYTDLYENLPIAYVTVTVAGEIVQANFAAGGTLAGDHQKLIGTCLGTFFNSYDAGRLAAHLENCAMNKAVSAIGLTLRPPGAAPMAVQLTSRPAPSRQGNDLRVLVALSDVSRLQETQRILEDVNREQEAFSYSISHDLRGPLVTIRNYAEIVLGEHAEGLDSDAKAMVQRIESAARRLEETLKNLLEYSALSRDEIEFEVVDIEGAIADWLVEHRVRTQECAAEIAVERPMPRVRGCQPLVGRVVENLLSNALKYTHPGMAPKVRIACEAKESTVLFRVIDQGIGIEPEYHERIFRIFERLHGYSRYPGTGVGLAICRRAIERMGGRIWCESQPGQGSTFCFELPKA